MLDHVLEWLKAGSPPHWLQIAAVAAYVHLEWWLGRTDKVKANSGLEAMGNGLKRLLLHKVPLIGGLLTAMASKDDPPSAAQEPPK